MRRRILLGVAPLLLIAAAVSPQARATGRALLRSAPDPTTVAGVFSAPVQLDRHRSGTFGGYDAVCPSVQLCFDMSGSSIGADGSTQGSSVVNVGDGDGWYDFDLNPGWQDPQTLAVSGLTCPSAGFCAGIANYTYEDNDTDDFEYDVVVSAAPAAGAPTWTYQTGLKPEPDDIACPSAQLCAISSPDGLYVSTDPSADTWTAVTTRLGFVAVSCPSTAFCAAVDAEGRVWTSSDPGGGPASWTSSAATGLTAFADSIDSANQSADANEGEPPMESLPFACDGPALCVADRGAAQGVGTVAVSTDPAGPGAWTPVQVSSTHLPALACVPAGACVAGDSSGHLIAANPDPATVTTAAGWTSVATRYIGGINTISCTSALCVAAPIHGGAPLLATPPPAPDGAWTWAARTVTGDLTLSAISCPAAGECIATDDASVYRSIRPERGASGWSSRRQDLDGPILDSACWSQSLCLAAVSFGGESGNGASGDVERFNPQSSRQTFTADVAENDYGVDDESVAYVACAQRVCVMGSPGSWYRSTNPADTHAWHAVSRPVFDATCLGADRDCVGLAAAPSSDIGGPTVSVAARRGGPWHAVTVDPGQVITGLACTTRGVCVIVDAAGHMRVSTDPLGGAGTWTSGISDPDGFTGVACPTARRCLAVDDSGRLVSGRF